MDLFGGLTLRDVALVIYIEAIRSEQWTKSNMYLKKSMMAFDIPKLRDVVLIPHINYHTPS